MFDIADPGWAAMLACDDDDHALFGEPEPEPPPLDVDQTDPASLTDAQRVDYLIELERRTAALHARHQQVLAVIDAADPSAEGWSQETVMLKHPGRTQPPSNPGWFKPPPRNHHPKPPPETTTPKPDQPATDEPNGDPPF